MTADWKDALSVQDRLRSFVPEALMHLFNAVWVGHYLGISGTLLILCSVV